VIQRLFLAFLLSLSAAAAATCNHSPYRNEVSVTARHIIFQTPTTASRSEQQGISGKIQSHFHAFCRAQQNWQQEVSDEANEIAIAWFQDRGYFKAQIHAQGIVIAATGPSRLIDFRFNSIAKGQSYRLGEIFWKGMSAFPNRELRQMMPIQDGEVFSREKIAQGLENLRNLYVSHGYLNFTSIPNTSFDDEKATAYMDIDGDEGLQFHFRNMSTNGLDDDRAKRWQSAWDAQMRGRTFSEKDLRVFLKHLFRPTDPKLDPLSLVSRDIDLKHSAVDVSMTFYAKSAYDATQSVFTHR
jgi:outer membrane protein assembly factor BamA